LSRSEPQRTLPQNGIPRFLEETDLHMNEITNEDLNMLAAIEAPNCVSFYLPTHSSGGDVAQDSIRLKNLIAIAKDQLEQLGLRRSDTATLLEPVESLLDDEDFWAHATAGLAIFATSVGVRRFRLAGPVAQAVAVADHLWVAPMIPFVTTGAVFHLLALSQNQVRLLRATRHQVTELDLHAIPASMADALRFDDHESQLQSHGAGRVGSGEVSAMLHGHGGAGAFDEVDQRRFLHAIERGISGRLGDGTAPLVLAGVEGIVSEFRNLSSYANITEGFVAGNSEQLSLQELHAAALPLVAPDLDAARLGALERLTTSRGPSLITIPDVLDAASSGRVADLFVLHGPDLSGDELLDSRETNEGLQHESGDRDLIDRAVRETLAHGGGVFAANATEMPGELPVAAVLRY
jgi:hypothetical protein